MKKTKTDSWIKPSFDGLGRFLQPIDPFTAGDEGGAFRRKRALTDNNSTTTTLGRARVPLSKDTNITLNEKYEPKTVKDLCLHRKKLEDVTSWFTNVFSLKTGPRILVLSGPTGAGKTVCLKAVARDKDVRVVEWLNPVSSSGDPSVDRIIPGEFDHQGSFRDDRSWISENQTSQFSDFLLRTEHYCPLPSTSSQCPNASMYQSSGHHHALATTGSSNPNHRVLLVEDLPNTFFRDPTSFHEILRKLCGRVETRVPVVFIMSDCPSSSMNNYRRMFPAWLLQQFVSQIHTVTFNSVASSFIVKAVKQILDAENVSYRVGKQKNSNSRLGLVKSRIDWIAETSNGDLRLAVNELQFELEQFKSGRGLARNQDSGQSASSSGNNKDSTLMMFHALGKVLYAKRTGLKEYDTLPLPPALAGFQRSALKEIPEEVVDRCFVTAPMFNLFLHQNYLTFVTSLDELSRVSDYMSLADLLSDEQSMDIRTGQFASSVAARGMMFASSAPQRPATWTPLHRPAWLDVAKRHSSAVTSLSDAFYDLRMTCDDVMHEILPFLPIVMDTSQLTIDQQELLSDSVILKGNRHQSTTAQLTDRDFIDDAAASNSSAVDKPVGKKSNQRCKELDAEDLKKKSCFMDPVDCVIDSD